MSLEGLLALWWSAAWLSRQDEELEYARPQDQQKQDGDDDRRPWSHESLPSSRDGLGLSTTGDGRPGAASSESRDSRVTCDPA